MVLGLCVLTGVRRRWRPVVVALAILGFVVLARPEPSVVRAAAMGLIGLLGMSRSRRACRAPGAVRGDRRRARRRPVDGALLRVRALRAGDARAAALHPARGVTPSPPHLPRRLALLGPGDRHSRCGTGDVRAARRAAPGLGEHRRSRRQPRGGAARRPGDDRRSGARPWCPSSPTDRRSSSAGSAPCPRSASPGRHESWPRSRVGRCRGPTAHAGRCCSRRSRSCRARPGRWLGAVRAAQARRRAAGRRAHGGDDDPDPAS